jgi:hypothetical protein
VGLPTDGRGGSAGAESSEQHLGSFRNLDGDHTLVADPGALDLVAGVGLPALLGYLRGPRLVQCHPPCLRQARSEVERGGCLAQMRQTQRSRIWSTGFSQMWA